MIPIKDNYKFATDPDYGRPDKENKLLIYKTKKIHPWSPFGARGAADRGVESIRFQVSIVRR